METAVSETFTHQSGLECGSLRMCGWSWQRYTGIGLVIDSADWWDRVSYAVIVDVVKAWD